MTLDIHVPVHRIRRLEPVLAACLGLLAISGCRGTRPVAEEPGSSGSVTAPRGETPGSGPNQPSRGIGAARTIALQRFGSGDAPIYPEMSRRLEEEGTVELRIELLQDGSIHSLAISEPSGYPRLDAAALAAARTWRFNPRTGAGKVEVIRHRLVFRLVDTP